MMPEHSVSPETARGWVDSPDSSQHVVSTTSPASNGSHSTPTRAPKSRNRTRPVSISPLSTTTSPSANGFHSTLDRPPSISKGTRAVSPPPHVRIDVLRDAMTRQLDPGATEERAFHRNGASLFVFLQAIAFLICLRRDFPTVRITGLIVLVSVFLMGGTITLTEAKTRGERILTVTVLAIILALSSLSLAIVTWPCTHCGYYWVGEAMDASTACSQMSDVQSSQLGVAWDLLLSPEEGCSLVTPCRKCVGNIFLFLIQASYKGGLLSGLLSGTFHDPEQQLEDDRKAAVAEEEKRFNISLYQTSDSMFGDLADWYLYHFKHTKERDLQRFNLKLAKTLSQMSQSGQLDDESLTKTMAEIFCSPASRFDDHDPNRFLADLKTPRFTGEEDVNITAPSLQSIMRGDVLHTLGVSNCFMLRFALLIQEDHDLEKKAIKYTTMMPSQNETGMKSVDYTFALPFLVTPGLDQDIDPESSGMKRIKRLMDLYVRFPFEDKPIYFDTKQEYYAFYRWQLEGTIQDEWYFPDWFLQTEKRQEFADFRATQLKVSNDHLVLEDPTSDRTLGDRTFYGTGQRFLTPAKFPGVHEDYEYLFPGGPDSYMTEAHNEKFRYSKKPKADDLMKMIHTFWPKEAKGRKRNGEYWVPLGRFKDRVVEIDLSVTADLESRKDFHSPGCILYLDPKTKLPMGIWEASRKRLFLPNEGRDWEHAKYYYRVTERAVLATLHVIESHFGWSQAVATAAWQTLPVDHILRVLLKPFTLNVHSVNWAAYVSESTLNVLSRRRALCVVLVCTDFASPDSFANCPSSATVAVAAAAAAPRAPCRRCRRYHMLVREHSVLTHGSGFTTEGVVGAFMTFFRDFNFSQSFPESLKARRLDEVRDFDPKSLPYHSQGVKLYDLHHTFVGEMLALAYPTDEALLADGSVVRFWSHVNTYGRHLDPCVCGLPSDLFYDDNGVWPMFETKRTCTDLLDLAGFDMHKNVVSRRRDWCTKTDEFTKVRAVRALSEKACEENRQCNGLLYDVHYQRLDMSLPELKTREQLVNFLATFIWHVTAGVCDACFFFICS